MTVQVPCQPCNGSGSTLSEIISNDGQRIIIPVTCSSCGGTGRA